MQIKKNHRESMLMFRLTFYELIKQNSFDY